MRKPCSPADAPAVQNLSSAATARPIALRKAVIPGVVRTARVYDTAAWDRLRKLKLANDPFCQIQTHCAERPLLRTLAAEVDHIVPVSERPELRFVYTNLQSACKSCHSAKTRTEQQRRGRGGELSTGGGLPPPWPPNSCDRSWDSGGGPGDEG
jgi:5-methylcytosine-specific restriction endonuclease McrA